MIKLAKDTARALLTFAHKGPVRHPSSQRAAMQAYDKIKDILTEDEQAQVMVAWSHSTHAHEGRKEFDGIMKKILQRFWVS